MRHCGSTGDAAQLLDSYEPGETKSLPHIEAGLALNLGPLDFMQGHHCQQIYGPKNHTQRIFL
jgi:hypothetical protein